MLIIGIDQASGHIYEGSSTGNGRGLWPPPIITPAEIVSEAREANKLGKNFLHEFDLIFREDYFDPVTKIRRGRFYKRSNGNTNWRVYCHPAEISPPLIIL